MTTSTEKIGVAVAEAAAAQSKAELKLRAAQEFRRLVGDPRIRVEVPTVKVAGNSQRLSPMSRRYSFGS